MPPPIICIQKIALSLSSTSLRDLLQDKLIVSNVHIKYHIIAGNFREVKYSFFSWQADLDKNFTPQKHYRNAPNTVRVVKQKKILLTKLTAVQTKFLPHENYPLYGTSEKHRSTHGMLQTQF